MNARDSRDAEKLNRQVCPRCQDLSYASELSGVAVHFSGRSGRRAGFQTERGSLLYQILQLFEVSKIGVPQEFQRSPKERSPKDRSPIGVHFAHFEF